MGWFDTTRALLVRLMFSCHGFSTIWLLARLSNDTTNWYIVASLSGLVGETIFTIYFREGQEWKWFCPSVFFYLVCVVPPIWLMELLELEGRIREEEVKLNFTWSRNNNLSEAVELEKLLNQINLDKVPFEVASFTSEQIIRMLEQVLLLFLILGRWMLPKGELTHEQLSELLLVYIATAADIVEFFDAFKEDAVKFNRPLCVVILSIWSWSLLQFSMVLTATKKPKEVAPPSLLSIQQGLYSTFKHPSKQQPPSPSVLKRSTQQQATKKTTKNNKQKKRPSGKFNKKNKDDDVKSIGGGGGKDGGGSGTTRNDKIAIIVDSPSKHSVVAPVVTVPPVATALSAADMVSTPATTTDTTTTIATDTTTVKTTDTTTVKTTDTTTVKTTDTTTVKTDTTTVKTTGTPKATTSETTTATSTAGNTTGTTTTTTATATETTTEMAAAATTTTTPTTETTTGTAAETTKTATTTETPATTATATTTATTALLQDTATTSHARSILLQGNSPLRTRLDMKGKPAGLLRFGPPPLRKVPPKRQKVKMGPCFTPEVFGIIISMFLQDAPFLVLRLLLIFQYDVVSYTNMFFTCKNSLVCLLLTYRITVIQIERCAPVVEDRRKRRKEKKEEKEGALSGLIVPFGASGGKEKTGKKGKDAVDLYYHYSTKVQLKEYTGRNVTRKKKDYTIHQKYDVSKDSEADLCDWTSDDDDLDELIGAKLGQAGIHFWDDDLYWNISITSAPDCMDLDALNQYY